MKLDILRFKLQQALQNNSERRTKLATTWKIVPSRLAHYKTSKLLYAQPIPDSGKKYKCDILLDISWSMYNISDRPIKEAIRSVQNLISLFHWIIDFRIIGFWNWFVQFPINRILSIDTNREYEFDDWAQLLSSSFWVFKDKDWNRNLVPMEGWAYQNFAWTWWPAVLWQSIEHLKSINWNKFIVFITDWRDALDRFWCSTTGYEAKEYIDQICWVPIDKYCPENYSNILEEANNNDICILPIWINIALHNFRNYIDISSADQIYEETINFINKNFNN